jgi:hypothetical protein
MKDMNMGKDRQRNAISKQIQTNEGRRNKKEQNKARQKHIPKQKLIDSEGQSTEELVLTAWSSENCY